MHNLDRERERERDRKNERRKEEEKQNPTKVKLICGFLFQGKKPKTTLALSENGKRDFVGWWLGWGGGGGGGGGAGRMNVVVVFTEYDRCGAPTRVCLTHVLCAGGRRSPRKGGWLPGCVPARDWSWFRTL